MGLDVTGSPNAKDLKWLICLSWNLVINRVKSFSELCWLETLPVLLDYILRNLKEHGGMK